VRRLKIGTAHTFGMEWKEHIAWIALILATVAAGPVVYYGGPPGPQPNDP
jgi:hypothetical protein